MGAAARVIVLACLLVAPIVTLASAEDVAADPNAAFVERLLRARAAEEGIELPDLATLVAERTTIDSATGAVTIERIPLSQALAESTAAFRGVDLAQAGGADVAPGTPIVGVGDNIHLFANIRFGDCSAPTEYTGVSAGPSVPGAVVPNPTATPFVAAIVWGGKAFHVRGGDWLLGAHLFMGAPIDANVNTAEPGIDLALGLDSTIEAVGVGTASISTSKLTFFGICLASIDLGTIFMNGALYVDHAVPENAAGL